MTDTTSTGNTPANTKSWKHDTTPDQSTAVEAVARKSPSLLDAPATYLPVVHAILLWFAVMLRSGTVHPALASASVLVDLDRDQFSFDMLSISAAVTALMCWSRPVVAACSPRLSST